MSSLHSDDLDTMNDPVKSVLGAMRWAWDKCSECYVDSWERTEQGIEAVVTGSTDKAYAVHCSQEKSTCECEHWRYRRPDFCKHILTLYLHLSKRGKLDEAKIVLQSVVGELQKTVPAPSPSSIPDSSDGERSARTSECDPCAICTFSFERQLLLYCTCCGFVAHRDCLTTWWEEEKRRKDQFESRCIVCRRPRTHKEFKISRPKRKVIEDTEEVNMEFDEDVPTGEPSSEKIRDFVSHMKERRIYDIYEAEDQETKEQVMLVLMSIHSVREHFPTIKDLFPGRKVVYSDPCIDMGDSSMDANFLTEIVSRDPSTLKSLWCELEKHTLFLLRETDATAVSLGADEKGPFVVIYVPSIHYRALGKNPIPDIGYRVKLRLGIFLPKSLESRAYMGQRLCDMDGDKPGSIFTLGGIIAHEEDLYGVTVAHGPFPYGCMLNGEKLKDGPLLPFQALPMYKVEQVVQKGKTAKKEEVINSHGYFTYPEKEDEAYQEKLYCRLEKHFGKACWACYCNITESTQMDDEKNETPGLQFLHITGKGEPCAPEISPLATTIDCDRTWGADCCVVELETETLEWRSFWSNFPYSGKFTKNALDIIGHSGVMSAAHHLRRNGIFVPISYKLLDMNPKCIEALLLDMEKSIEHPMPLLHSKRTEIFLGQIGFIVNKKKDLLTYNVAYDEGDSGGWVFDEATGDAVGMYTAATGETAVLGHLYPMMRKLAQDMEWVDWEPSYVKPGLKGS